MAMLNPVSWSPFTKATAQKGADETYKVIISRDNDVVVGYSQDRFKVSMTAEYQKIGSAVPVLGPMIAASEGSSLYNLIDSPQLGGGLTTQKMYTGSSDISFSIQFTVIDEDGTGEPINKAKLLLSWCSPRPWDADRLASAIGTVSSDAYTALADTLGSAWNGAKNTATAATNNVKESNSVKDAAAGTLELTGSTLLNVANGIDKSLKQLGDAAAGLSQMKVKLKLGDFFEQWVVLTGADVTFSREQGVAGPLFAEYILSFTMFKTPNSNEITTMFYGGAARNRVSIQ